MSLVYTALITPFNSDGSLNLTAFQKHVEAQLEAGIHGVVVCGSTGEGMTLEDHEKETLLKAAVELVGSRIPVVMGAGHASTKIACEWQKRAKDLGASHTLHIAPWYIKPTSEGLEAHFQQIASVNNLPIILYNHPGRTGTDMPVDVIVRLAKSFKHLVALKEVNCDAARVFRLLKELPEGFKLLSGDDCNTLPMLAMGGHGLISTWSNFLPERFVELVQNRSPKLASQLALLSEAWPTRPNPIPVKTAMGEDNFRLPLKALEPAEKEVLLRKISETRNKYFNTTFFK